MIRNFFIVGLILGLAVFITISFEHVFKSKDADFFILEKGKPLSNFSFETLDGEQSSLSDFAGKPVIVHFWATWCPPCLVEFPELITFAEKNTDNIVLAVSSDRNREAIHKMGWDVPSNLFIIFDEGEVITREKFSVFRLPETYVFDAEHRMTDHIIGAYKDWPSYY